MSAAISENGDILVLLFYIPLIFLFERNSEVRSTSDIVAAAVLSGNRNFEGRVHPLTRANYLASPPLVVAYALAGTVCMTANLCPISAKSRNDYTYLATILT